MPRRLSERESAVLAAVLECMPPGGTGEDLAWRVRKLTGAIGVTGVSVAGIHQTAASLCRKNLAWRAGSARKQVYKITQPGRDALRGDQTGKWVARSTANTTRDQETRS